MTGELLKMTLSTPLVCKSCYRVLVCRLCLWVLSVSFDSQVEQVYVWCNFFCLCVLGRLFDAH